MFFIFRLGSNSPIHRHLFFLSIPQFISYLFLESKFIFFTFSSHLLSSPLLLLFQLLNDPSILSFNFPYYHFSRSPLIPLTPTPLTHPNTLSLSWSIIHSTLAVGIKGPCSIATATTQHKQPRWILGNWVTSQEQEGAGGAAQGGRCHTHTCIETHRCLTVVPQSVTLGRKKKWWVIKERSNVSADKRTKLNSLCNKTLNLICSKFDTHAPVVQHSSGLVLSKNKCYCPKKKKKKTSKRPQEKVSNLSKGEMMNNLSTMR